MTKKNARERLNLRIPGDLLEWVRRHARKKNTTVTQIFVDHLTELKEGDGHGNKATARPR